LSAAEHLKSTAELNCHTIAKCQQAVEKAMKGLHTLLYEHGAVHTPCGRGHKPQRIVDELLLAPLTPGGLLNNARLALRRHLDDGGIIALCNLAPKWPPEGEPFSKNTEYPYQVSVPSEGLQWRIPSAAAEFDSTVVHRWLTVASDVVRAVQRLKDSLPRLAS
jgi:hypothetical protein